MNTLSEQEPLSEPGTIASDPWLTTLVSWSEAALGPEWTAYSGAWPQSVTVPALMWQMIGMDVKALGPSSYEIQKRMTAFFQAEDADREHAGLLRLLEALGAAVKIPLDGAARRFLRISEPKMRVQADSSGEASAAAGPLTVTLIQRTAKPVEAAPLMQFVHYQSKMR